MHYSLQDCLDLDRKSDEYTEKSDNKSFKSEFQTSTVVPNLQSYICLQEIEPCRVKPRVVEIMVLILKKKGFVHGVSSAV